MAKIEVEITRTCLSFLMRDNALSDGDQEGFLIGEVARVMGRDISDHAVGDVTETTVIKITSHMFMSKPCAFYNGVGLIDPTKISKILGPFKHQIVGYFDFKRENPPELGTKPSFRMSSLFRELNKWAFENIPPNSDDFTINPLTMMVLRQFHSENKSILNNTYCFYVNKGSVLEKIGSKIPNLGDTSNRQYVSVPPVSGLDEIVKTQLGSHLPPTNPEQMPVVKAHNAILSEIAKAGVAVDAAETKYRETHSKLREVQKRKQELREYLATLKKAEEEGNQEEIARLQANLPPMPVPVKEDKKKEEAPTKNATSKKTKSRIMGESQDTRSNSPSPQSRVTTTKSKQEISEDDNNENASSQKSPILPKRNSRKARPNLGVNKK